MGKKFGYYSKMQVNFENFEKKYLKFKFLSQKTLFLGQKVWKKFGKSLEKFGNVRKLGFLKVRKFRKLFFSELSKNYKKMTLNSNFGNREKLVPT